MKKYVSITRLVITLCGVMVILSAGCRDPIQEPTRPEMPSVTSDGTGIEMINLERDAARREVRVTILSEGQRRLVTIRQVTTTPLSPAMCAEITDTHGNLLYRIELSSDTAQGKVWFREQTRTDVLTTSLIRSGGRVIEEYDINGDVLAIEYAVSDDAAFDRVAARHNNGEAPDATPELREASARLAELGAFCAPHMGNTLHNNRDGELLLSLLSEPDFASLVTGTVEGSRRGESPQNVKDTQRVEGPQFVKGPLERICWAAFTCASLMCRIGGVSNPVCVACGGVAAACIITEIASWFAGCDGCF